MLAYSTRGTLILESATILPNIYHPFSRNYRVILSSSFDSPKQEKEKEKIFTEGTGQSIELAQSLVTSGSMTNAQNRVMTFSQATFYQWLIRGILADPRIQPCEFGTGHLIHQFKCQITVAKLRWIFQLRKTNWSPKWPNN